jgi:hypothetical protein
MKKMSKHEAIQFEVKDFQVRRNQDTRSRQGRVYVVLNHETILENLVWRRARPHQLWKPIVKRELEKHGIHVEKLSWSQKAGCSCGCSPGFKSDDLPWNQDIFITVDAREDDHE